MGLGSFGGQYDPTEYNMGAAALARMQTVLDSSGTRKKKKKKKSPTERFPLPGLNSNQTGDIHVS